jgi:hypothetical protein
MISFNPRNFKFISAIAMISILSACGGGGGGSEGGNGGFTTSNTNAKPQVSSTDSSPESSVSSAAESSSPATQSSKSSASSNSKSSQSKSSISSSKAASSSKPASNVPDTTPPVNPSEFYVASAFSDAIFLSWSKATDNVAVVAYKLYRDGIQIADLEEIENFYADYNVAAGKSYTYGLSVGDVAGNWSSIITLPTTVPTQGQASSRASNTSSSKASSATSSKSSASSKSSSSASVVIGVSLQWQRPIFRENGSDFFEHELGGYELHYKPVGSTSFIIVKIDPAMTTHILSNVASNAEFEIAAFDTNNLYSRFIPLHPI